MKAYKDQFTPAEPIFTVIDTANEWSQVTADEGRMIDVEVAEKAEFNSAAVVHAALICLVKS